MSEPATPTNERTLTLADIIAKHGDPTDPDVGKGITPDGFGYNGPVRNKNWGES